jgi:phage major head subunit gpT-like protein
VVPTSLVPAAEKVLKAQLVNGGDSNTYAGKLELVVNKYLTA